MAKFYTVIKGSYLLKHFQQVFFMKMVFEHQIHNAIQIFVTLRDPKLAAMTS